MDTIDVFSAKAEKYAKYRWGYAPEAIQTIFDQTGIAKSPTLLILAQAPGS